ncbi:YkgJ family cysteine cluster protein [Entomomonas moraniae]|uniref:YkgJ family cysteine cluster protein n=1 Tax=Entomomonas moraniae TaxID=2213226 RepID=A0A451EPU5_9GAMM|nr:YkgJ family cysteine cluster protein [Entomomonas moraniae]AZS51838.1 YkgJ family cysteine cluster protein [Entomomonas moraniae]
MANNLIPAADPDRLETWAKYHKRLCDTCQATCCQLPVEIKLDDLIRLGILDDFARDEPLKNLAKQLKKQGVIEHFNQKKELFTITRLANNDCYFLDTKTRRCTVYTNRPNTCRNHPQIGPRPNFCAYRPK